jgi:hypothetical protein
VTGGRCVSGLAQCSSVCSVGATCPKQRQRTTSGRRVTTSRCCCGMDAKSCSTSSRLSCHAHNLFNREGLSETSETVMGQGGHELFVMTPGGLETRGSGVVLYYYCYCCMVQDLHEYPFTYYCAELQHPMAWDMSVHTLMYVHTCTSCAKFIVAALIKASTDVCAENVQGRTCACTCICACTRCTPSYILKE